MPLPKPNFVGDFEQNDSLNIADLSLKSPGINVIEGVSGIKP